MKRMVIIFNHQLTEEQKVAAQKELSVAEFITMPQDIASLWGQVPAEPESISSYISPVVEWAIGLKPDVALVQGDFGATYEVVCRLKAKGIKVVYATTERKAVERTLEDGSIQKTSVFQHVRYRSYRG